MKFKITFKVKQPGQLLPMSYQYELSSWIYKMIYKGDNEFANLLHSTGYEMGKKRFKLFTFSRLYIPNYDRFDDRMKILCDEISFTISFFVPKAAQNLIVGLFDNEDLGIGDRITQVDLKVQSVETIDFDIPSEEVRLRTTSPIVVNKSEVNKYGKHRIKYINPSEPEYATYFLSNLIAKYKTAKSYDLIESIDLVQDMQFKLLSDRPKMQGVRIKAHTPAETKVIGYAFDFKLKAPKAIIKLGMLAGFGNENAMGFGATKFI